MVSRTEDDNDDLFIGGNASGGRRAKVRKEQQSLELILS